MALLQQHVQPFGGGGPVNTASIADEFERDVQLQQEQEQERELQEEQRVPFLDTQPERHWLDVTCALSLSTASDFSAQQGVDVWLSPFLACTSALCLTAAVCMCCCQVSQSLTSHFDASMSVLSLVHSSVGTLAYVHTSASVCICIHGSSMDWTTLTGASYMRRKA